jgi:hypothetical protein
MSTVMLIVLGVVAITVVSVIGDMVSKVAQAKIKAREAAASGVPLQELEGLRQRVAALESRAEEREDRVQKLQDELSFVSRMLEDKTGGRSAT